MISLAIVGVLAISVLGGASASEFNLKGFKDPLTHPAKPEVTLLKFGEEERRRVDGKEEITVTLSNGDEYLLALTTSDELRRLDVCVSSSTDQDLDVLVTGCDGEDRSITIGGHGTWDYESATDVFRRVQDPDEDMCSGLMPPDDDEDAMMMNQVLSDAEAAGQHVPSHDSRDEFDMEVRYYYDRSLYEKYGNDHNKARNAVREMHEHAKVMMRHSSIGRPIHLVFNVDPTFIDFYNHAGPSNALPSFMQWLDDQDLCQRDIAFHHLITDKRSDGVSGVAWVGTVCHSACYNTGITEIWGSTAGAAHTLAHEFGHNIGALHTFSSVNQGRDCHGIMSYGSRPKTWSECSKERWLVDYDLFVEATDQTRADKCFRPVNEAPAPTPPAPTPNPAGGCKCSGRTNSNGDGGADCTTGGSSKWCYTEPDACSDGRASSLLDDQEWSYKACSGQPAPTPPTPAPPSGDCKCSGESMPLEPETKSKGAGGPDCATIGSGGAWCYTKPNACSDGRPSSKVDDQDWSYKACAGGPSPVPSPTTQPPATTTTKPPATTSSPPPPTPSTPAPPSGPGSYTQMPGSGWCMEHNGEDQRARYTMPYPTTKAKTKAACDADSSCVAWVWGETKRVGMIYSTKNCSTSCSSTQWQTDRSLITKAGWDGQRTWWKDCTCNVKN